ncbi:MAG: alpha/beta fold hydrolase [Pseudomonadota bacterium]
MTLQYQTYGNNRRPALILLHGLLGSSTNWSSIGRQLSTDYYVLVPDLRNHGNSPHVDGMTYTEMTQDLIRLLEHERIAQATFVGHSMGGKLAMRFALLAPHRVRALGVVDVCPVTYNHTFDHYFDLFASIDLTRIHRRDDAQQQMIAAGIDEVMQFFLLQNLRKTATGWAWRINLAALKAGQPDITGFDAPLGYRYDGKTWVIYGTESDYVLPEYGATLSAYFPGVALHPVVGAGHWVHVDQPQQFIRTLQQFLET